MALPKGVHHVISRGREYFYWHPGRGTLAAGERIRLPDDPTAPEFWDALRQCQGITGPVQTGTINALIDAYLLSPKFTNVAASTQYHYKRHLKIARDAWGDLQADKLRPKHLTAMMEGPLALTPGKGNAFLGTMQALAGWALGRGLIEQNFADGVARNKSSTGHRPWTPAEIACAHESLTGMVRRGILLALYTGQRGSDVVRLGWTDVDEGGFRIRQRKTGREIWCPIVPELAAEMATWEKRPGPFLLQPSGNQYTRPLLWKHFDEARQQHSELRSAMLHGLRATAVVRLRQAGLATGQIGDIVGMSLGMIERYCRFADMKQGGQAALISLERTHRERGL